jgi:hypothetical protein
MGKALQFLDKSTKKAGAISGINAIKDTTGENISTASGV